MESPLKFNNNRRDFEEELNPVEDENHNIGDIGSDSNFLNSLMRALDHKTEVKLIESVKNIHKEKKAKINISKNLDQNSVAKASPLLENFIQCKVSFENIKSNIGPKINLGGLRCPLEKSDLKEDEPEDPKEMRVCLKKKSYKKIKSILKVSVNWRNEKGSKKTSWGDVSCSSKKVRFHDMKRIFKYNPSLKVTRDTRRRNKSRFHFSGNLK